MAESQQRVRVCEATIAAHEAKRAFLQNWKTLSYFNVAIESTVLGGAGWLGFYGFQVSSKEKSLIRAVMGNSYAVRIFNPLPLAMLCIAALSGLFVVNDVQTIWSCNRGIQLQTQAIEQSREEVRAITASRPVEQ